MASKARSRLDAIPPGLREAYRLGGEHAAAHQGAVETYNVRPPDRCPYAKGSDQEKVYDQGWRDHMDDWR